jgi:predicted RND superfamily exporter protein
MGKYVSLVIKYRYSVLAIMFAISVFSAFSLRTAEVRTSPDDMIFAGGDKFKSYEEKIEQYGLDMPIFVGAEFPHAFAPENMARLSRLEEELGKLKFVGNVVSILDVPDIRVEDGYISFDTYADKAAENPERADEILAALASDPLAEGLLISADGRHLMVVLEPGENQEYWNSLSPEELERELAQAEANAWRAEAATEAMNEGFAAIERAGFDRDDGHVTGIVAYVAELMRLSAFHLKFLFPAVAILLLASIFIIFRRMWPVAITGVVSALAVLWTMAFAVLVFKTINIMIAAVPAVVVIIAFSDVIHLCSSYLLELSHGESKDRAIFLSCSEVGTACIYTSLTTFLGFMAMTLVPTPLFRQFGAILGFGVAIALLIAVTITPILFTIMPEPAKWRGDDRSGVHGLMDKLLDSILGVTQRRPMLVTAVFGLIFAISIAGISRIKVEKVFAGDLKKGTRMRDDLEYFGKHFAGTNLLEIYIEGPRPGDMIDPEVMEKISKLQKRLEALPEVDKVTSMVDLITAFHSRLNPEAARRSPVPDGKKAVAQYLFLLEDSADLERLMDPERRTIHITARMGDGGIVAAYNAGMRAVEMSREFLGESFTVELTGFNFLMGEWLDEMVTGQRNGLVFAFTTIDDDNHSPLLVGGAVVHDPQYASPPRPGRIRRTRLGIRGTRNHAGGDGGHRHRSGRHHPFPDALPYRVRQARQLRPRPR